MIEDMGDLRNRIANQAENIARDLLGEPNPHLSKNRELRWGKNGKIVCSTSGKYAGRWYDFSSGEGGDLFDLARREKSGDFVKAKEYLQSMVGMSTHVKRNYKQTTNEVAPKDELFKIRKVQYFYNQSTPLYFGKSTEVQIVKKYLETHRGIDCFAMNFDLRASIILNTDTQENYPAFTAFLRNAKGEVTGAQVVYLNSKTGDKADIAVPRRAFGKISGSFVRISQWNDAPITIITEGVETALSLKQAGVNGKIIAGVGVHNFKNYEPIAGEKIIIAADNDGQNSITLNTVNKAVKSLENKGANVIKVTPPQEGDFNDLLRSQGAESVRNIVMPEIAKLTVQSARTVNQNDVKDLYERSSPLYYYNQKDEANVEVIVANKYLENHTGIYNTKIFDNPNLRAIWNEGAPALTVFVRNEKDEITGAQVLYLDSKTCNKIQEKIVGKIDGSFATIQNSDDSPITIITKDIETALSLKQAKIEGKIICGIDASNTQNYKPFAGEKLILASNDRNDEAKKQLASKGAEVQTIMKDFNNILQTQGAQSIRNIVMPEVAKLSNESNIQQPRLCPKI